MMDDYSPDPKWYVAHTYAGYENKVRDNIFKIVENRKMTDVIVDVVIPTEAAEETEGDEKENANEAKVFPSYVLIKMVMSDETWHVIRNIRGVTGFVGPGSKPVALTDAEVAALGIETGAGVQTSEKKSALGFKVGDTVALKEDVLFGVNTAVVTDISPDGQKVSVLAFMFGRETPIELDAGDLKPIE